MEEVDLKPEDRSVVVPGREAAAAAEGNAGKGHRGVFAGAAIELPDGSGLKLTVARYHTPSGRCIHGEGIAPDVELEPLPEREPGAASGPDPQIEAALERVRRDLPAAESGGRRAPGATG